MEERCPKATIVFTHGVCEHALRALPLAIQLAHQGFRTVLFDVLGHGAPPPEAAHFDWLIDAYAAPAEQTLDAIRAHAGDLDPSLLKRLHHERWLQLRGLRLEQCFDQLDALLEALPAHLTATTATQHPETPIFLAGHSLGGLIATCTAARRERTATSATPVAGVVLINPALRPKGHGIEAPVVAASWGARRGTLLAPLRPLVAALARVGPSANVRWASAFVSDVVPEQQIHAEDPLILKRLPLPFLREIERWMSWAQDHADDYPLPVLLHAAEEDPIVDTRGSESFMRAAPTETNALHLFPGFAHDLSRASAGLTLQERTVAWLTQQVRDLRSRELLP